MLNYQKQFIEFAIANDALKFGEFTLKSGRISPYFFNSGVFATGSALAELGKYYAATVQQTEINFDMLFGLAYKGIPLVATTTIALATHYNRDIPYCFNRKEIKTHGEGSQFVGTPLKGRVLIIDDVVTAGTAKREAINMLEQSGAKLAGILIALDRRERGEGKYSAIQELEREYDTHVYSIINLDHVIKYLSQADFSAALLQKIRNYRKKWGERRVERDARQ